MKPHKQTIRADDVTIKSDLKYLQSDTLWIQHLIAMEKLVSGSKLTKYHFVLDANTMYPTIQLLLKNDVMMPKKRRRKLTFKWLWTWRSTMYCLSFSLSLNSSFQKSYNSKKNLFLFKRNVCDGMMCVLFCCWNTC